MHKTVIYVANFIDNFLPKFSYRFSVDGDRMNYEKIIFESFLYFLNDIMGCQFPSQGHVA